MSKKPRDKKPNEINISETRKPKEPQMPEPKKEDKKS